MGDRQEEALSVGSLGLVCYYLGDHETAKEHSQQALPIAQETGELCSQGALWPKLGHALAGLGQLDEAAHPHDQ
jgi:tetratricopeptide (TPR) repeat protein